jgi:hypothetical protein
MLRRETIIALRARHTAFRIAVEILYPQQPPPAPAAQPAIPVLEDGEQAVADWQAQLASAREREWRQTRMRRLVLAVLSAAVITGYVFVCVKASTAPAPPPTPPQARPILPTQQPLD